MGLSTADGGASGVYFGDVRHRETPPAEALATVNHRASRRPARLLALPVAALAILFAALLLRSGMNGAGDQSRSSSHRDVEATSTARATAAPVFAGRRNVEATRAPTDLSTSSTPPPTRPTTEPSPLTASPTPFLIVDPSALPPSLDPALRSDIEQARHRWREGNLTGALESYRRVTAAPGAPLLAVLEQGEVELASGDTAGARANGELAMVARDPDLRARARFLVATADISLGNLDEVPRLLDASTAPDGLGDFAALRRAQAADKAGQRLLALKELERPEVRASTNRVLLDQAAQLANALNAPGLASEMEEQAGGFQGWTADRTRLIQAAARDAAKAGQTAREISEDRFLVASFGWTPAATWALADLGRLGELSPYDKALVEIARKRFSEARADLLQASTGPEAAAARQRLVEVDDSIAWRVATDANTEKSYHAFAVSHPNSPHAADARFAEGLARYVAGQYADALQIWSRVPPCVTYPTPAPNTPTCATASANAVARGLFWSGKALQKIGRTDAARVLWLQAASTRPTGYYALRAGDVLAGNSGWPTSLLAPDPASPTDVESWLHGWAGALVPPRLDEAERVRRGLGLLELGDMSAATAELNGVIADTRDPWLLDRLAHDLAKDELWSSSARAAHRLIALSPARTAPDAPLALQRLAYPPAYLDLVRPRATRLGIDPLLFLSLMFQESGLDPLAQSLVGARGLTQVMPATAAGVAPSIGLKGFSAGDLDRPAVAIPIGAAFFADQIRSFRGDPFRALAAYNAGAGPIAGWAAADPDLFVERIDYAETKEYVQKIYLHDAEYRRVLGH